MARRAYSLPNHLNKRFNGLHRSMYSGIKCTGCGEYTMPSSMNVIWKTDHGILVQDKWSAFGGSPGRLFCEDCQKSICPDCAS